MKISAFPIYRVVFEPKKELLLEKVKRNKSPKNLYILSFFGKEKTTELLVSCELNHFLIGFPSIIEHIPVKIDVINNQGKTDGSDFVEWLRKFIGYKGDRFDSNIYNENAKDMVIKNIDSSTLSIKKFILCGCTIKNVVFYDNREKNKPQMTIEMNIKSGFIAE